MTIYPAIDLRRGRCVRLTQGDFGRETVYGDDPVTVARRWEVFGARWLHVVDLDGARAGWPVQAPLVAAICAAVRVPVQVGGGLRDLAAAAAVLEAGAARVVLGTIAVREPGRAREICRAFPGRVAIGIDARAGVVQVAGWLDSGAVEAAAVARAARDWGASAIVYTDIARDGTEQGPDLEGTRAVARAAGLPVIASGGVGALDDIRGVAALGGDGVTGVIVGRALYTGAVDLREALGVA